MRLLTASTFILSVLSSLTKADSSTFYLFSIASKQSTNIQYSQVQILENKQLIVIPFTAGVSSIQGSTAFEGYIDGKGELLLSSDKKSIGVFDSQIVVGGNAGKNIFTAKHSALNLNSNSGFIACKASNNDIEYYNIYQSSYDGDCDDKFSINLRPNVVNSTIALKTYTVQTYTSTSSSSSSTSTKSSSTSSKTKSSASVSLTHTTESAPSSSSTITSSSSSSTTTSSSTTSSSSLASSSSSSTPSRSSSESKSSSNLPVFTISSISSTPSTPSTPSTTLAATSSSFSSNEIIESSTTTSSVISATLDLPVVAGATGSNTFTPTVNYLSTLLYTISEGEPSQVPESTTAGVNSFTGGSVSQFVKLGSSASNNWKLSMTLMVTLLVGLISC